LSGGPEGGHRIIYPDLSVGDENVSNSCANSIGGFYVHPCRHWCTRRTFKKRLLLFSHCRICFRLHLLIMRYGILFEYFPRLFGLPTHIRSALVDNSCFVLFNQCGKTSLFVQYVHHYFGDGFDHSIPVLVYPRHACTRLNRRRTFLTRYFTPQRAIDGKAVLLYVWYQYSDSDFDTMVHCSIYCARHRVKYAENSLNCIT
jgi:hypothetical protein